MRELVDPGWDFARYTYSTAVRAGGRVYVSGLDALGEDGVMRCPGDLAGASCG